MKKFIYSFMVIAMALVTFTACSDDDNEEVGPQNPEQEVAGVYTGSWHQVLTNSAGEVQSEKDAANAVVELSAVSQWVAGVTVKVADPVIKTEISEVANCSGNSTSGYILVNTKGANLGNFSARVNDGVLTLTFITTIREGRKTYTATNVFTGVKGE